jgi:predicted O-methyltransferase YrrM
VIKAFDLAALLDGVEGYLHDDEPLFLAQLASCVPAGQAIVEIGSFRGRSTIALAYGAPDGVLVYSVDPHDEVQTDTYRFGMDDQQEFMHNVSRAGLGHKVKAWNMSSLSALQAWHFYRNSFALGLVFIDGDHEYNEVKNDVMLWRGYLARGGIMAIHDSTGTWEAPTRVANELAQDKGWTELDTCAYTRTFTRKRREA